CRPSSIPYHGALIPESSLSGSVVTRRDPRPGGQSRGLAALHRGRCRRTFAGLRLGPRMESVQWRAFFATSEVDYTRICPHLIDDVAKNRIERNRTIDGELWRLFEVGGPQDSTRVPLAGNSRKLGGLEKREIGAVTPPTAP